ncbi:uncharacterized protein LOC142563696 isoform X2 [Dermacentor variabilis]|uniref:uncharacterized protein LOC142563696 isoform X2 n=1 Tax=Dermacentor variabilis TaxID=34621 RepID=UPI003F5B0596
MSSSYHYCWKRLLLVQHFLCKMLLIINQQEFVVSKYILPPPDVYKHVEENSDNSHTVKQSTVPELTNTLAIDSRFLLQGATDKDVTESSIGLLNFSLNIEPRKGPNIPYSLPVVTTRKRMQGTVEMAEARSASTTLTLKTYVICDQRHASLFNNSGKLFAYVTRFMSAVSAILQQLETKISLEVIGVQASIQGTEDYLKLSPDGEVDLRGTVLTLITYTSSSPGIQRAHVIYLLSARSMFSMEKGVKANKYGIAPLGGACSLQKVAIVKDNGQSSGVNTAAHETAHLSREAACLRRSAQEDGGYP